jgi:hypothetical protein
MQSEQKRRKKGGPAGQAKSQQQKQQRDRNRYVESNISGMSNSRRRTEDPAFNGKRQGREGNVDTADTGLKHRPDIGERKRFDRNVVPHVDRVVPVQETGLEARRERRRDKNAKQYDL